MNEMKADESTKYETTEEMTTATANTMLWYDVNWARDVKCNLGLLVTQDTLALIKSLVASVTLFYLTRPGNLLQCSAVKFQLVENLVALGASSCTEPGGTIKHENFKTLFAQPLVDDVPVGEIFSQCEPSLRVEKNDTAFAIMIIVNQLLFLIFIVLRATATRGWFSGNSFMTKSSYKLAFGSTLFAISLSIIKITVALSYRIATIYYTAPSEDVQGFGHYGSVGHYIVPSAANCSEIEGKVISTLPV